MIHAPARYWPLASGSHLSDVDWQRCSNLADRGARSVLVFSFYRLEDIHALLTLGYRDVQLRLWHEWGPLPDVGQYIAKHEQYISDLLALCEVYGARLSVCPLNEPNLELQATPETVAAWLKAWRRWMREHFPAVELTTPALCRSTANAYIWLEVLHDEYKRWDSIGVHYYWLTGLDLEAGAPWSPEWMHERFSVSLTKRPDCRIRVTECGGADGTSRQWRYDTYPKMLARHAAASYVVSVAVYLLSSEDPKWQEHWYDDEIVKILGDVAEGWPEKPLPEIRLQEDTMAPIAVAICPSNQDRNRSPFRADYSEFGGMHWQAPLIAEHCRALGINAEVMTASPESTDSPAGSLSALKAQQLAANAWLDQQPQAVKSIVNLHTDSGDFSHTFAIYGEQNPESRRLAEAIGPLVHDALSTASYRSFSKLGSTDYSSYVFAKLARYPACLIEECAHTVQADIDNLYARPHQVAEAIARGIADYAGIGTSDGEGWKAKHDALAERLAKIQELATV